MNMKIWHMRLLVTILTCVCIAAISLGSRTGLEVWKYIAGLALVGVVAIAPWKVVTGSPFEQKIQADPDPEAREDNTHDSDINLQYVRQKQDNQPCDDQEETILYLVPAFSLACHVSSLLWRRMWFGRIVSTFKKGINKNRGEPSGHPVAGW